ncbi:CheY-like superfamily [Penicillium cf. griseofulvum]|uniref:non-specific serine/threonine protein kinase n=1 Tax=Penicillium cf. griseofulvum TaxID=2972120 RepID=A0A9W9M7J2_9EURO|nr:CheY-like superfamily [Penicillium cf. griseofulvum]KAJ5427460.1 CheY-like superfamily [Penicillium cf. griseofulvum]
MATNDFPKPQFLAPPAVTALRQEARNIDPKMTRTLGDNMREEREDLKEAAEQTLNIIVDMDLEGCIKWVSPSWKQVVGSSPESVEGHMISEILLGNKDVFRDAIESMKQDDSRSRFIRFALQMGPDSVLKYSPEPSPMATENQATGEKAEDSVEKSQEEQEQEHNRNVLNMEGQGIMVYDRTDDEVGHTMWMLRPLTEPREVTIDLPPLLVESLGVGAEVLANYLTELAEAAATEPDPSKHPAPTPVLCRICERQITPWWFEKHSDLCLQEHRAEMDVQMAQENLNEHRHVIVKVLDALEARQGRPIIGNDGNPMPLPQAEYKGLAIGPSTASSAPSSGHVSGSNSAPGTPPRSREHSVSGAIPNRPRSFTVRRPLARIVELVLDLCDTSLEISMPMIKESSRADAEDFRTLSPQSESRISQVLQWQSPSANTLEQEQGLAALSADTEQVARAKVDAVIRHRKIVEYAERIRIEYTVLVQECIGAALSKAERIAAGQLSDSSCSSDEEMAPESTVDSQVAPEDTNSIAEAASLSEIMSHELQQKSYPAAPSPRRPTSALTLSMRNSPDRSFISQSEGRPSSAAVSTGSNSPLECPTPRSHKSAAGLLGTSQPSRLGLSLAEIDAGDSSDGSLPSSAFPGAIRTDSPSSERSFDRKRRSLVLPGLSSSPRRQPSPARVSGPHSPLRMPKPRMSSGGGDSLPSPVASPSTYASELALHHCRHHRRQSSANSSDVTKPPPSPRLSSMSQQQPRPAPLSIRDFEIIKPISKGAFGSVYLVKKKATGEYYAMKVLKKADMIAKNQVTNVKAERAIMMWQGESDFVAKLYWTFSSKDYLYLVMEYLNGGDCSSLVKVLGGLPEDWAKKYIGEVVLGVEHLHSRGIVHRDLKPDNLLIDQTGHLKLTDFGLSRMGLVGRQKRILRNPDESAPDLLKQNSFPRAMSIASSRSASFDFQASSSPGSTPLITPEVSANAIQPSYFSLNQAGLSRQSSRRASGYRSDSMGSDGLNGMFRTFSLNDNAHEHSAPSPSIFSTSMVEEEGQSEAGESPRLQPLQPTFSNPMALNTPPQQSMMPPVMALFDPEDHDRRFVGTPDYLAPETINGVGQDEISDWWSLGCIMFEFIFGYPPFNADTPDQVFDNILHRRINWPDDPEEYTSAESLDLMNKLMTLNPRDRIGANVEEKFPSGGAEICSHPWLSDINWDTLLEDKAQFVPNIENPEDTEYFDARGATLQTFAEELEDENSPQPSSAAAGPDRPHDALFKVRSQANSSKRPLMPLHIPPHVRDARDSRSRRLSEPALADDFGSFNFKNLPMLEKANKDVIQKMRQEALQAQHRQPNGSSTAQTPVTSSQPSLEGSPLPMSLQRTLSQNKGNNRPSSPSGLSQTNSSPSRPSQPSSPLLVQFSTGANQDRRKTSGSSSASHQSSGTFQPSSADQGRMPNLRLGSVASSPVRSNRIPAHSPDKTGNIPRHGSVPASRTRSHTIGSQDGDAPSFLKEPFVPHHHKRRSQLFDISPSSSDNEDPRTKALLKVQRRRQSSRRLSQINILEGPFFRPLDVLICEDHPVSRLVMERLFEKLRCRTITVTNGAEAVRYALSEVQFDIIMTEYRLPQVNGVDFARMVRETRSANRHTPIIAVTGYLKDLPENHNFDALIQKPPTLPKLTEALSQWCMWKPPPPDYNPSQPVPVPGSGAQSTAVTTEDSPSSASSGFVLNPPSSYPGSSRNDSVSSSVFGDMDSFKPDDIPVIINRNSDDWDQGHGGLGISEEPAEHPGSPNPNAVPVPHLLHAASAPAAMDTAGGLTPRRQRSTEAIRAKKESLEKKRYEGAESGDDEDEELGNSQTRRSPPSRNRRPGSKLGIEMMRTNSRGSVVSGSEELLKKEREALRNQSAADHEDSDGSLGSPASTSLEDHFEDLSIPEESEGEESVSPRASSPRFGASASQHHRPSLAHQDASIYSGLAQCRTSKTSPTVLNQGQTTPPWDLPQRTISQPTGPPITPEVKISGSSLTRDAGQDVDTDNSPTPDADATPRPLHPSPSLDPEQTPRPAERHRSDLSFAFKR